MKIHLARAQAYGGSIARVQRFPTIEILNYLWLAYSNFYSLCGGRLDEDVTSIGIKYLFDYS